MKISLLNDMIYQLTLNLIQAVLIEISIILVVYAIVTYYVPQDQYDSIIADKSRFSPYLRRYGITPFLVLNSIYMMGAYLYGHC